MKKSINTIIKRNRVKSSGKTFRIYHFPDQKIIETFPEENGYIQNFQPVCLGNCKRCKDFKLNQKLKTRKKNLLHFSIIDYYINDYFENSKLKQEKLMDILNLEIISNY